MATFHTEDLSEPVPPVEPPVEPPPEMRKEDHAAWKKDQDRLHKQREDERKVRVEKQKARSGEAAKYTYAVVRTSTNAVECMCEGKPQAEYIAMLLNDRPK